MRAKGEGTIYFDREKGRWVARIEVGRGVDGRPRYRKRLARTKAEATVAMRELQVAHAQGRIPLGRRQSLEDFARRHFEVEAPNEVRASTLANYQHLASHHVYPYLGRRPIGDITSAEMTELFALLRERLSASTVNQVRSALSRVFEAAIRHRLTTDNPVRRTKKLRPQYGESLNVEEPWNVDECRLALIATAGTPFEAFLHVAVLTGLRRGEILGLRWSDIDFGAGVIRVRHQLIEGVAADASKGYRRSLQLTEPKTDAGRRVVAMDEELAKVLSRHQVNQEFTRAACDVEWPSEDYVFRTDTGEPHWPSNFSKKFRAFLASSGLRHIRIHDVRHSFAQNCLALGVDLPSLSRAMGHSSLAVTNDVYGRSVPQLADRATERLSAHIFEREANENPHSHRNGQPWNPLSRR